MRTKPNVIRRRMWGVFDSVGFPLGFIHNEIWAKEIASDWPRRTVLPVIVEWKEEKK